MLINQDKHMTHGIISSLEHRVSCTNLVAIFTVFRGGSSHFTFFDQITVYLLLLCYFGLLITFQLHFQELRHNVVFFFFFEVCKWKFAESLRPLTHQASLKEWVLTNQTLIIAPSVKSYTYIYVYIFKQSLQTGQTTPRWWSFFMPGITNWQYVSGLLPCVACYSWLSNLVCQGP